MLPESIGTAKHVLSVWDDPSEIEAVKQLLFKEQGIGREELPTRVLDLGIGQKGDDDIRLFEPPDCFEPQLYATLSHCWLREDVESSKTLTTNIQERKDRLSLSELPDSFQQCVAFCRRMGIQYLWIDSLCIVQNDATDWDREAATMHLVYARSWFTIAMHGSTRGCIPYRDIVFSTDGQETTLHVRRIPELLDIVQGKIIAPQVSRSVDLAENSAWNAVMLRGWCFQERVLSNRMIHFTDHEFLYEARGVIRRCQCRQHFNWQPGMAGRLSRGPLREDDNYRDWTALVTQYTQRMFGRQSDVLPGFQGIAVKFAEQRRLGAYLCGLWERDLLKLLCWKSTAWASHMDSSIGCDDCRPHPKRTQGLDDQAVPSWSWASRFGPCEFVFESWNLEEYVEDADFLSVCEAESGGQYLRLRGSLYACRHFSTSVLDEATQRSTGLCSREYAWAVPDTLVKQWDLKRDIVNILKDAMRDGVQYRIDAEDDLPKDNSKVYLFPLFAKADGSAKLCLVLKPADRPLQEQPIPNSAIGAVFQSWIPWLQTSKTRQHWLKRIGIAVFENSFLEQLRIDAEQIIYLT
jgi:hypothetical protein